MEDCEMLTKLFEEIRTTKMISDDTTATAHNNNSNSGCQQPIIYTTANNAKNTKLNPASRYKRLMRRSSSQSESKKLNENTSTPDNSQSTDANNSTTNPTTYNTINNKQKFDTILKPLLHIVLACQMESEFLIDFVKDELYADFGLDCVGIWQLIMSWKGETKDAISANFEQNFSSWEPKIEVEPLLELPYLRKLKHIVFLK